MYREAWFIYGVKYVKFKNEEGSDVKGYQVYYCRKPYDDIESVKWVYGDVCPSKPQWINEEMFKSLMKALNENKYVFAVYEPAGRFNRLSSFEVYDEDNEISLSDMLSDSDT